MTNSLTSEGNAYKFKTAVDRLEAIRVAINLGGWAQVETALEAEESVMYCQRSFREVAFLEVHRAGYEFFVYNEIGRQWLGNAIQRWLAIDTAHVEQDYQLLHTLGFQVPHR